MIAEQLVGDGIVPLAFDHEQGLTLALYERGCSLLEQCMKFDETKYWDSLSDAAMAWGKIHKSDRVEQLARALKLRAFRRLGELAEMERPITERKPRKGASTGERCGRPGGPASWLIEQGLDRNQAQAAQMLQKMPADKFDELTRRRRPPLPTSCRKGEYSAWQQFYMRSAITNVSAATLAISPVAALKLEGIERRDQQKLLRIARQLSKWFSEFADEMEKAA